MTAVLAYPFATAPEEGAVTQVAPGILWLRLPLPMVLNHVNCYALDDGDGWTILDTGMATKKTKAIWQTLLAGPLSAKPVKRVIVTHHHPDHVGLAGWFQAQGAELVMPRMAWVIARMLVLDVEDTPKPETLEFYRRAGLTADQLAAKAQERPFNFADVVAPLPLGFTGLVEGQILTAAGRRWRVRFGQGHAPDHAMLFSLDDHIVLGGDQLLPSISPNISVYSTEPDADPLADYLASIASLQPLAREDHLILPGHKLPFTGLPRRLSEMADDHEAALVRLADLLATPRRAAECFPVLFKRPIGPDSFFMAMGETLAHLNCLLRRGLATRDLSPDGAWIWQRA